MLNANQATIGRTYFIDHLNFHQDEDLAIRLSHLGFLENQSFKVIRKTPFTGDCLLIEIRGTQMALTKFEADLINLREKK